MKKLYEQIPIETWKKIAYRVQRLKISDYSDKEFEENLNTLKELLSDLDISLAGKVRKPKRQCDIGLASLLHEIYFSKCGHYFPKANFYKYIYRLSDLGIQSIEFKPVKFPSAVGFMRKAHSDLDETTKIEKCYTDGAFKLDNYAFNGEDNYDLTNLEDASYLFNVHLYQPDSKSGKIYTLNSSASIKNFNGKRFPEKSEIKKMEYPELRVTEQTIRWGESPKYRQVFDCFDETELSCAKRLTKTPDGFAYYKEYHK